MKRSISNDRTFAPFIFPPQLLFNTLYMVEINNLMFNLKN